MKQTQRARVQGGYLHQSRGLTIRLDGTNWWAWLEQAATKSFSYGLEDCERGYIVGWITVRKEKRERGSSYWLAYRRQGRQLRKRYLGTSKTLTAALLAEVAHELWTNSLPTAS